MRRLGAPAAVLFLPNRPHFKASQGKWDCMKGFAEESIHRAAMAHWLINKTLKESFQTWLLCALSSVGQSKSIYASSSPLPSLHPLRWRRSPHKRGAHCEPAKGSDGAFDTCTRHVQAFSWKKKNKSETNRPEIKTPEENRRSNLTVCVIGVERNPGVKTISALSIGLKYVMFLDG